MKEKENKLEHDWLSDPNHYATVCVRCACPSDHPAAFEECGPKD